MAETAEDLLVRIDATTEQLRREMRRADESVGNFQSNTSRRLKRIDDQFQRFNRRIKQVASGLGAIGFAATAEGLRRVTQSALSTAESIADVSKQTGLAAEELQGLREAFDQNGSSASQADAALIKFNRRIGLARSGTGAAAKAVEQLNIDLSEIGSTSEALDVVVSRIENTEDASRRAAIASRFFGEDAGPKIAPLLAQGSQALDAYTERLRRAGTLLSDDLARDAGDASATLRRVTDDIQKAFQIGLLESFASETDSLTESLDSLVPIASKAGEQVGELVNFLVDNRQEIAAAAAAFTAFRIAGTITNTLPVGRKLKILIPLLSAAGAGIAAYDAAASSAADTAEELAESLDKINVSAKPLPRLFTESGKAGELFNKELFELIESSNKLSQSLELAELRALKLRELGAIEPGTGRIARDAAEGISDVGDAFDEANDNAKDFGDDARDQASIVDEAWRNASRSIQSELAEAFRSGSLELSSFVNIAKNAAAGLAASAVVEGGTNLVGQLAGGNTSGGGASIQNALGLGQPVGGQFVGGIGGFSPGFAGITTEINALGTSLGFAPGAGATGAIEAGTGAVAQGGLFGSTTLSGFAGGAGLGFAGGQLLNGILGGNELGGTIGSGGGALAGAAIGSVVPGVGTVIGGLLGGLAGGGIGGLFGNDEPPSGLANVGFRTADGRISEIRGGPDQRKDVDAEVQQQIAQQTAGGLARIRRLSGARFLSDEFGIENNLNPDASDTGTFLDPRLEGTFDSDRIRVSEEGGDVAAFLKEVFTNKELTDGVSKEVSTAIVNSTAENVNELVSDVEFASNLSEQFKQQEQFASAFLQTLDQLGKNFQATKARAEELGLSTDGLEKRFADLEDTVRASRAAQLNLEAAGVGQQGGQLINLARRRTTLRAEADELEGVNNETIAKIIQNNFDQATQNLELDQLKTLKTELRDFEGEIEGLPRIMKLLTQEIENYGDEVKTVTSLTAQEGAKIRGEFETIFGPQGIQGQLQSLGVAGTELGDALASAEADGIKPGTQAAEDFGERLIDLANGDLDLATRALRIFGEQVAKTGRQAQQTAATNIAEQKALGNNPLITSSISDLLVNEGRLDGLPKQSVTTKDDLSDPKFVSVFKESTEEFFNEIGSRDLRKALISAIPEGENRLDIPQAIFGSIKKSNIKNTPEDVFNLFISDVVRKGFDIPNFLEITPDALSGLQDNIANSVLEFINNSELTKAFNDPDKKLRSAVTLPSNFENLTAEAARGLLEVFDDELTPFFENLLPSNDGELTETSNNFLEKLKGFQEILDNGNKISESGISDAFDIIRNFDSSVNTEPFNNLVQAFANFKPEKNTSTNTGTTTGPSDFSGPDDNTIEARLRRRNPNLFPNEPTLNTRIQARGLGDTDVAGVLQGADLGNLDLSGVQKLAAEIVDVADTGRNAAEAIGILNALLDEQEQAQRQLAQAQQSRTVFLRRDETSQERVDRLNNQLDAPAFESQSAINDFVQGLDLTTEAGREAFQTAQNLASALSQLSDQQRQQAEEQRQQARDAVQDALSGVERASQERQDAIQDQIQDAQSNASDLENVFSVLERGVDGLRIQTDDFERTRRAAARNRLGGLLDQARGGNLPEADALSEVFDNLGQPDAGRFGTEQEFLRTSLQTRSETRELRDIADDELTEAEQQVKQLEAQQTTLEDQLETQREIAQRALGTFEATLGVEAAIGNLQSAISNLPDGGNSGGDSDGGSSGDGAGGSSNGGVGASDAEFVNAAEGRDRAVRAVAASTRGGLSTPLFNEATAGFDTGSLLSDATQLAEDLNLPTRAVGGPVTANDPFLVGERGPELFVPDTGGSVLPNGITGELRALRKEVAELREVTRGGFRTNNKATVDMEKRQKRWYNDEIEAGNI